MTEPAMQAAQPQAVPTPPANQQASQSPLDILDQILNDAQTKADKEVEEKTKAEERAREEELLKKQIEEQQLLPCRSFSIAAMPRSTPRKPRRSPECSAR